MLFSTFSLIPSAASRAISELAIITAAAAGAPTQLATLTPTVINPFRFSPLTLSILLSSALSVNPLQALFPLSWNLLAGAATVGSILG